MGFMLGMHAGNCITDMSTCLNVRAMYDKTGVSLEVVRKNLDIPVGRQTPSEKSDIWHNNENEVGFSI